LFSGCCPAVKENRYSKKKGEEQGGKREGQRKRKRKEKRKYRQTGDCAHFQPSPEA